MQDQFIPYEQALALKELGFDEPCFGYYKLTEGHKPYLVNTELRRSPNNYSISAPLWQQAARYLYINSNKQINFQIDGKDSYEELCEKLKKCIKDFRDL
jgi:hypothetical protein